MKARTTRMTHLCPYCGAYYTFRSLTLWQNWLDGHKLAPLHAICKRAAKNDREYSDTLPFDPVIMRSL